MNMSEALQNANLLVIRALDGLPEKEWDIPEHVAQISAFHKQVDAEMEGDASAM